MCAYAWGLVQCSEVRDIKMGVGRMQCVWLVSTDASKKRITANRCMVAGNEKMSPESSIVSFYVSFPSIYISRNHIASCAGRCSPLEPMSLNSRWSMR